jgi:hypothetical protein
MSPPPLTDDFLPQAHHQNPGHCIASFNLINRMRNNFQLCDVKLEAGGEVIHAHKVILASASPYFYAMFNGNYYCLMINYLLANLLTFTVKLNHR